MALDACVLAPAVCRGLLIGAAEAQAFAPLWSSRILEEWARAARKLPEGAEAVARAEIARLRANWPDAEIEENPALLATLSLPDPDDVHVFATAIEGRAQALVTFNIRDFPARTLARRDILVLRPDVFLSQLLHDGADISGIAHDVRERLGGGDGALSGYLKRARLPVLAKAIANANTDPLKPI